MKYHAAIQRISAALHSRSPQTLRVPNFIPAAVFIPFFEKNDEAHILFTRRSDTVEKHKGQVSFPGGAREAGDPDLGFTALREMEEEVGIPADLAHIIARCDDFPTISDFLVTPFVGTIPYPYPHRISRDEVAEILEVPLSLFLTDRFFHIEDFTRKGRTYPVYFYDFNGTSIWGVTGYIINRFIEVVFDYNPAKGE
ncbi:MAG: CoA pyrophosphatase [Calditrichaeota bacterium]|nr:CoA pyrophosphatase [Calditrichota bacterium]HQU74045.1 CoA pyrophosphatase [Calditrichia bacterium]